MIPLITPNIDRYMISLAVYIFLNYTMEQEPPADIVRAVLPSLAWSSFKVGGFTGTNCITNDAYNDRQFNQI